MSDFNYSDICWESNTAVSSIMFRECIEDCFLLQMLDLPARNSTVLDLLLTNQEHIFDGVSTNNSLGYSDHNIVEFKIQLSALKTSSRTKTRDSGRTNFNMLRVQLWGIPWEVFMEGNRTCECWELFNSSLLEAKVHPLRERKKAECSVLTMSFWVYLKAKKKLADYGKAVDQHVVAAGACLLLLSLEPHSQCERHWYPDRRGRNKEQKNGWTSLDMDPSSTGYHFQSWLEWILRRKHESRRSTPKNTFPPSSKLQMLAFRRRLFPLME